MTCKQIPRHPELIEQVLRWYRRAVFLLAALLALNSTGQSQDTFDYFRGDELGRRSFGMDEEFFLNVLSFEMPLETIQPWLRRNSGYRLALGSLTARDLWLDQELKSRAELSDTWALQVRARQGITLDAGTVFFQPILEYRLNDRLELFAPTVLDDDKGGMDGGLGIRYRNADLNIDFLQFSFIVSDVLFNERGQEYRQSKIRDRATTMELQAQGDPFDLGTTSLKVAYQTPSTYRLVKDEQDEGFQRLRAWLLHSYEIDRRNRIFFTCEVDNGSEEIRPLSVTSEDPEFIGRRRLVRGRMEYQNLLSEDEVTRWRGGVQYVNYSEKEKFPAIDPLTHKMIRSESIFYAGYRSPFLESETLSLETVLYLDWLNGRDRYDNNPAEDTHMPTFQGKVSFYFLWSIKEDLDFMLSPSIELDEPGWGGGAIQVRWNF